MNVSEKFEKLKQILKECGRLAVAYSGGTDSTLLMHTASSVLGSNACAITVKAEAVPESEISEAAKFCRENEIRHTIIKADQLDIPGFAENTENRCYLCKKAIFGKILNTASQMGCAVVAEGSNADDEHDFRPGMLAVRELGVISPLRDAGFTKSDIYAISRELGLPTASKPSFACLATRIPYGDRITVEKLKMAELSERYLREKGFRQVRVRIHGSMARIEVIQEDIPWICQDPEREEICKRLKELGFTYISLDLQGYRTGSMNEVLDSLK